MKLIAKGGVISRLPLRSDYIQNTFLYTVITDIAILASTVHCYPINFLRTFAK